MKKPHLLLVLPLLSCSQGRNQWSCEEIYNGTGFGAAIAHGIHSLTLNDLRHYFFHSTTEENGVPVVDMTLNSSTPVLLHAPLLKGDSNFDSMGLNIADRVLSHMDDNMYAVKNYNGLERIIHDLHMHEIWKMTRPSFKKLMRRPADNNICKCVVDISNNGVMEQLNITADKIRNPENYYKPNINKFYYKLSYGLSYRLSYNLGWHWDAAVNDGELEESMPPLVDETSWIIWRNEIGKKPGMKKYYKLLGLFLHCKLR